MNAFHVFWSSPLEERTCGGNEQLVGGLDLERKLEDYYLLTLALSALQYKRLYPGSRLKLYSDGLSARYLDRHRLLDCWDACDGATLDRNVGKGVFDNSCFYSVGKFFAYREERAPCVLLDVDLVLWERADDVLRDNALVFTHWEDVHPETYWYCSRDKLKTPRGYRFNERWDFDVMAANTSFVCFNHQRLMEAYTEEVIRFMEHNFVGGVFNIIKPELLFVEQRLLPMIAREMGLWDRIAPLIDTVWSCAHGTFTRVDERVGGWHFYHPERGQRVTHTWIAKQFIERNEAYRRYYCCRVIEHILALRPQLESALRTIASLRPYFELLTRYGTTAALVEAGAACSSLH
jgi:hypothetical protein